MKSMSIKRPSRKANSSKQAEKKVSPFESARDMVGVISAGAGIFTALLYLTGRYYASGYFSAMNIPSYQVNFSIWEYGEVAWLPLLLFPATIMIVSIILIQPLQKAESWISGKISELLMFINSTLDPERSKPTKKNNVNLLKKFANSFPVFFALVILTTAILQSAASFGAFNGRWAVLLFSPRAEIVSEKLLSVGAMPEPIGNGAPFVYKGFHLLVFNNGKYYLFNEIDPNTCKPLKVYVIDSSHLVQINLQSSTPVVSQCENEEILTLPFSPSFFRISLKDIGQKR